MIKKLTRKQRLREEEIERIKIACKLTILTHHLQLTVELVDSLEKIPTIFSGDLLGSVLDCKGKIDERLNVLLKCEGVEEKQSHTLTRSLEEQYKIIYEETEKVLIADIMGEENR